jgi:hypothetical protein
MKPSMLAITPGDSLQDNLAMDALGVGVFEGDEDNASEVSPEMAKADDPVAPPEPDDPCPFPDGYAPRSIHEATQMEQWCGRQAVRHSRARHDAELQAGRHNLEAGKRHAETLRVRTRDEQIAESAAGVVRAEQALQAARDEHQALLATAPVGDLGAEE